MYMKCQRVMQSEDSSSWCYWRWRIWEEDAYGVSIRKEIAARTGRDVNIGAVYATLDRLEGKGMAVSMIGEPTAERGGRAKRLFRLTGEGRAALEESCRAVAGMMKGLSWGDA
jgi:PadR family transcriptional regulator PadR